MATINHKTYNEATETFKDFNVYDGKETLIFKVDGEGGNVGIGTSSPTDTIGYGRALDIQSSTGAVVYLRDSNAPTTQYGFLAFDGSDNGLKLHNANSSGFLRFDTNATEKMRITSAGNVGIGTPSPDGRLHVLNGSAGSVTANGNADELIVENSSTGGLSILTPDASTGYIMFGSPADNEGAIIRYTPSGTLMTIGTEVANGALAFRTATGTEAMRITSTGNVGIGTSAPATKLEIFGTGNTLRLDSAANGAKEILFRNVGNQTATIRTDGDLKFETEDSGKFISFFTNSGAGSSEKMRITSAGNVGIGNSSPTATLDVTGTLAVSGAATLSSSITASGIASLGIGETTELAFIGDRTTVNTRYIKFVRASALTDIVNIQGVNGGVGNTDIALQAGGGNVGIGTSSPTHNLTVGSASPSDFVIALRGGVGGFLGWDDSANATILQSPNTRALVFQVNSDTFSGGTEAMRITSTGNVGIGTSTANTLLSIDGAADNGLSIQGIGTTSTRAFFGLDTSGDGYLSLTNGSSFAKNVQLSSDLSVSNYILGNVGIGTDAPSRKLVVYDTDVNVPTIGLRTDGSGLLTTNGFDLQFANNNTFLANRENGYMSFLTGNVERMRILAAGNVGIGTSAPNVQLEVSAADNSLGGIFRLNNNRTSLFDGDQNGSIQFSNNEVSGGANGVRSAILSLVRDTAGKTDLAFTTASTNAAATEKVRILADGGLTFNGDTAAANALDDYEEGTWTMGIAFGGSSVGVTFSQNTGTYTKIGRQVTATGQFVLTSKGAEVGDATLTGLPFTSGSGVQFHSGVSFGVISGVTFADMLTARVAISATNFGFYETTNAGAISPLTNADFANNSQMAFSVTYFV